MKVATKTKWVPKTKEDVETLAKIRANPYYLACFRIESGEDPLATNRYSSAKGAFQLILATRKALGVKDWSDLTQNFNGFVALTKENMKLFKTEDPRMLYAAHYLGSTILKKVLKMPFGKDKRIVGFKIEEEVLAEDFYKKIRPRFERIYQQAVKEIQEMK